MAVGSLSTIFITSSSACSWLPHNIYTVLFLCVFSSPTYNLDEIAHSPIAVSGITLPCLALSACSYKPGLNGEAIISGLTKEPDVHIQDVLYMIY